MLYNFIIKLLSTIIIIALKNLFNNEKRIDFMKIKKSFFKFSRNNEWYRDKYDFVKNVYDYIPL